MADSKTLQKFDQQFPLGVFLGLEMVCYHTNEEYTMELVFITPRLSKG